MVYEGRLGAFPLRMFWIYEPSGEQIYRAADGGTGRRCCILAWLRRAVGHAGAGCCLFDGKFQTLKL